MPGWQGLWTDLAGVPAGYSFLVNKNPRRTHLRRFVNREGSRVVSELFDSLIGAATGGTALAQSRKVRGETVTPTSVGQMGGSRPYETVTHINRATTAADVTALKEMTFGVKNRPVYVRDLSGNGGPAYSG
jgi:hypothetical protein